MTDIQEKPNIPRASTIRNTVIVTGFGPFGKHPVNASWEAVKLLPTLNLAQELGVDIVTEQIPVSYEDVGTKIPRLWSDYKPLLVIHVGVSEQASKVTLEQVANKSGYKRQDIYGQTPACHECCVGSSPKQLCGLDLFKVSEEINSSANSVATVLSSDAGRYLCEYIYYTSLSIDCLRALFIHVPPLDKPYSAAQLAAGLADVIRCLVKQLRSHTAAPSCTSGDGS